MKNKLDKTVRLGHLFHRDKHQIRMDFPNEPELRKAVDNIEGRKWSATKTCWYVENTPANFKKVLEVFEGKAQIVGRNLFDMKEKQGLEKKVRQEKNDIDDLEMDQVLLNDKIIEGKEEEEKFEKETKKLINKPVLACLVEEKFDREMKLRGKSPKTIETYKSLVNHFLHYHKNEDIRNIEAEEIKKYIMYKIDVLKFSKSYQNQLINALKRYFEYVYERMFEDFE
ncbi:MAG: site-specific integrase, partial [Bacteroidota bacterium]